MVIQEADITSLGSLRKKIELNIATFNDYDNYRDILLKYDLNIDSVVNEYGYSTLKDFAKEREKAKQIDSFKTEGAVLGAILGVSLGLSEFYRRDQGIEDSQ